MVLELLNDTIRQISENENNGIMFIDFAFFPSRNIGKKILYYLTTSIYINVSLRCIIVNFFYSDIIKQFNYEIRGKAPFIYKPIICCRFDYSSFFAFEEFPYSLHWIGVKWAEDEKKTI